MTLLKKISRHIYIEEITLKVMAYTSSMQDITYLERLD
jgi:hypothetical protein